MGFLPLGIRPFQQLQVLPLGRSNNCQAASVYIIYTGMTLTCRDVKVHGHHHRQAPHLTPLPPITRFNHTHVDDHLFVPSEALLSPLPRPATTTILAQATLVALVGSGVGDGKAVADHTQQPRVAVRTRLATTPPRRPSRATRSISSPRTPGR